MTQVISIRSNTGYPEPFKPGEDGTPVLDHRLPIAWFNETTEQAVILFDQGEYPFTGQPTPIVVYPGSQSVDHNVKPGFIRHHHYTYRIYIGLCRRNGPIQFGAPPFMPPDGPAVIVNS